jgi:hypothetical protein
MTTITPAPHRTAQRASLRLILAGTLLPLLVVLAALLFG